LRNAADLKLVIVEGAAMRIRPKFMTVATMKIGLLPILSSTATGADLMKRIAAPMVGGLASSFLMELLVYPVLYMIWRRSQMRQGMVTQSPSTEDDYVGLAPQAGAMSNQSLVSAQ